MIRLWSNVFKYISQQQLENIWELIDKIETRYGCKGCNN
mgnify:CR=1 FL=1